MSCTAKAGGSGCLGSALLPVSASRIARLLIPEAGLEAAVDAAGLEA